MNTKDKVVKRIDDKQLRGESAGGEGHWGESGAVLRGHSETTRPLLDGCLWTVQQLIINLGKTDQVLGEMATARMIVIHFACLARALLVGIN